MNFNDLSLKCIKGIPIDSVEPKSLSELGFPVEAPVRSDVVYGNNYCTISNKLRNSPYCVSGSVAEMYIRYLLDLKDREAAFERTLGELREYGLTAAEVADELKGDRVFGFGAEEARTMLDEFVFIIEELLPRQLSDVYYSFDVLPNPAHFVFFDLAAAKLNIERYEDAENSNYGQLIGYPFNGVCKRIDSGESFQDIYRKTCATKTMISNAWRDVCRYRSMPQSAYHRRRIEFALFGLSRKFRYEKKELSQQCCLFRVFDDADEIVLTVAYLSEEAFRACSDYDNACSVLLTEENTLVFDFSELEDEDFEESFSVSRTIRRALKCRETAAEHARVRRKYFAFDRAWEDCEWNFDAIQNAKLCGCFSCLSIFAAAEVKEWDIAESACCPRCGATTVVADSQGYVVTVDFLSELKKYTDDEDEEQ